MTKRRKPLRVLHLIGYLCYGGLETWLMEMMRKNNRKNLEIGACLTIQKIGPYEEEFQQLGGQIHRCPLSRNRPLAFAKRLKRILINGKYDILHSHLYFATGYCLKIAHKIPGLKLVAHIHPTADLYKGKWFFPRPLFQRLMKRWINNYADVILGASIATLENFWGLGWKENPRLFFQPNGIDLAEFEQEVDPAEIRKTLNLPQDCRIVLTVGRFVPHKNQKIIPEIAAEICSELSDVYFVLNGVGPLKENVENRVKELGLKNRFRFASGFPSLIPLWKSSDVFLFPSLMEGFGIVIIEAAAAGLPVIACNIPAITEAASACNNAILIDVNATVDQWAEAVKKALDSGKLKGKDYENFKRSFQYTTQNSLHNLLKIYNQIAGKK